jgi:hypothetical protein
MVIMLATGPKIRGFIPDRGRWISRTIKFHSTTSFGGEAKPSVSCRKMLRHVKKPYEYGRDT